MSKLRGERRRIESQRDGLRMANITRTFAFRFVRFAFRFAWIIFLQLLKLVVRIEERIEFVELGKRVDGT